MPPRLKGKQYINPRLGANGLNLKDPSHAIGEFQLRVANAAFLNEGGVESMYGYGKFSEDDSKTGGINMIHGFSKSDGTNQLVFMHADNYYWLPVNAAPTDPWNLIGNYGTETNLAHAATYNNLTIFGTGVSGNTPKKWDGTNFTDISTPANGTEDLSFFAFFQGQDFAALFGAGDPTAPSRLYYCATDNPDDWSPGGGGGFIDIAKDDGEIITGLVAQGEQLIVYKGKNRYYLKTFYESSAGVYGLRVSPFTDNSGGAVAHDTIKVTFDGDVTALARKGIGLQGVGKLQSADGSLVPKEYSRDVIPLFNQINYASAILSKAVVFDRKVWLSVPFGRGQTSNNFVLIYDIDQNGWTVVPDWPVASFEIFVDENGDDALYWGHANRPAIFKMDENNFTFDGEIIPFKARTGRINVGNIIDREDITVCALEGGKQEGDELTLTFISDGVESQYTIDDSFIVNTSDGSGYIGTDYIADEYIGSGSPIENLPRWLAVFLVPQGQRLAREFEFQVENENTGARVSWNHLSIDEIGIDDAKVLPPRHIIELPKL